MLRRAATVLASAVVLSSAVAACGSGGGAASTSGDIEIGVYAPLSGKLASAGTVLANGIKLGIDQANAAGGIDGRKIHLNVVDDTGTPSTAVTVATQLAGDKKTVAVIGSFGSSIGMPSSAALEKARIPNIQAELSTPAAVDRGFKYLFNTYPLGTQTEDQTFLTAVKNKQMTPKRVALIYLDSPFATASAAHVAEQASDAGFSIVSDEKIQATQSSYASTLTKVKAQNPDTIWLAVNPDEAKTLLSNMQQINLKPTNLYGEGNPLIDPTVTAAVGTLTEGVLVGTQWWPGSPTKANADFLNAYKAKYGETPGQMGPGGYQAAQILVAALKTLKPAELTRDNLRKALANLQSTDTVYGPVTFGSNGQLEFKSLYLLQMQGGTAKVILPAEQATSGTKLIGYLGSAS
ncbi:ABC transporter substrate-binding protein [Cryptosporangium sp. NPDC048952]|uniref:ABC transporter substrate-binding protein n=1 Tax=Cryptosporangium sp. NPDC048952 TaxID=3363961 RepID=UPI00371AC12D